METDKWMEHYKTCSMKELRQHVGQSMGLSTNGSRETLLKRIVEHRKSKETP